MPKLKTNKAASKRFRKTASGFKRGQSHKRHILTKKSAKRIRQLRPMTMVHASDVVTMSVLVVVIDVSAPSPTYTALHTPTLPWV